MHFLLMLSPHTPLIVIPARMQATRLPGKPLALIGDAPMIVQVMRRALEADIGPVLIACDGEEIAAAVHAHGGTAIITDPALPSGSDRVWEAVKQFDPEAKHDIIINLQGDLPTLAPHLLRDLLPPFDAAAVDITTLAAVIARPEEHASPNVVKAVRAENGRALYFTRATAPHGEGSRYHHIGVYAYRRSALQRFVSLPPSPLELREKLEQLRALEAGMRIDIVVADTVPLGVDTPEDLQRAREILCP